MDEWEERGYADIITTLLDTVTVVPISPEEKEYSPEKMRSILTQSVLSSIQSRATKKSEQKQTEIPMEARRAAFRNATIWSGGEPAKIAFDIFSAWKVRFEAKLAKAKQDREYQAAMSDYQAKFNNPEAKELPENPQRRLLKEELNRVLEENQSKFKDANSFSRVLAYLANECATHFVGTDKMFYSSVVQPVADEFLKKHPGLKKQEKKVISAPLPIASPPPPEVKASSSAEAPPPSPEVKASSLADTPTVKGSALSRWERFANGVGVVWDRFTSGVGVVLSAIGSFITWPFKRALNAVLDPEENDIRASIHLAFFDRYHRSNEPKESQVVEIVKFACDRNDPKIVHSLRRGIHNVGVNQEYLKTLFTSEKMVVVIAQAKPKVIAALLDIINDFKDLNPIDRMHFVVELMKHAKDNSGWKKAIVKINQKIAEDLGKADPNGINERIHNIVDNMHPVDRMHFVRELMKYAKANPVLQTAIVEINLGIAKDLEVHFKDAWYNEDEITAVKKSVSNFLSYLNEARGVIDKQAQVQGDIVSLKGLLSTPFKLRSEETTPAESKHAALQPERDEGHIKSSTRSWKLYGTSVTTHKTPTWYTKHCSCHSSWSRYLPT